MKGDVITVLTNIGSPVSISGQFRGICLILTQLAIVTAPERQHLRTHAVRQQRFHHGVSAYTHLARLHPLTLLPSLVSSLAGSTPSAATAVSRSSTPRAACPSSSSPTPSSTTLASVGTSRPPSSPRRAPRAPSTGTPTARSAPPRSPSPPGSSRSPRPSSRRRYELSQLSSPLSSRRRPPFSRVTPARASRSPHAPCSDATRHYPSLLFFGSYYSPFLSGFWMPAAPGGAA